MIIVVVIIAAAATNQLRTFGSGFQGKQKTKKLNRNLKIELNRFFQNGFSSIQPKCQSYHFFFLIFDSQNDFMPFFFFRT